MIFFLLVGVLVSKKTRLLKCYVTNDLKTVLESLRCLFFGMTCFQKSFFQKSIFFQDGGQIDLLSEENLIFRITKKRVLGEMLLWWANINMCARNTQKIFLGHMTSCGDVTAISVPFSPIFQ